MAPSARRRSRRSALSRLASATATIAVLAGAGTAAWFGAGAAADAIERRSAAAVRQALDGPGFDFAQVASDGLRVALTGTAPDEVTRFRAVERAGTVVDPRRIVDSIAVARPEAAKPPPFAVELLRNDAGISLIGLVPAATDRTALVARLQRGLPPGTTVTDLLESADYAAPDAWQAALEFGVAATGLAARAKVSIAAGRVTVTAVTDSAEDKARLETGLTRGKPEGVSLRTEISAPRPVIAPFLLRFVIDAQGARFDACAADTEAARGRILKAAAAAGAKGQLGCTLGLGAPTPHWGDAAAPAIAVLGALGKGTLTLSDTEISLQVPLGVSEAAFDEQVGRLEALLPAAFTLNAELERPAAPEPAPPEFTAARNDQGVLTLRGRIADDRMREAVESLARARYQAIDSSLRVDAQVPQGWTVRVIAALEAMAGLDDGEVAVTADLVRIEGVSGSRSAAATAAAVLARRLGPGARYELAIRYDPWLDTGLGLPDGETCVGRANAVLAKAEIGFAPGSASIDGDIAPTLAALAEALENCGDFRIEVGGHTDSQGSDDLNMTLSEDRAKAVLLAIEEAGIATANLTSAGYGESRPVESNETEAGRDANRRIEFRLVSPEPVGGDEPGPAVLVSGVTAEGVARQGPPAPMAGTLDLGLFGDLPQSIAGSAMRTGDAPHDDAAAGGDGATPAAADLPARLGAPTGKGSPPAAAGGAAGGSLWSGGAGAPDLRIETVAPPALTEQVPYDGPMAPDPDGGYTEDDPPLQRPDL